MVVQLSHGQTSHAISVFVVSPSTQSERSFPANARIADIKAKLGIITGIAAPAQKLTLHQPTSATSYELTEGAFIAALGDENKTLSDYGVKEGDIIKVMPDSSSLASSLYTFVEDPNVKKFELTDKEYAERRDTVMAYKARKKIGRFAEETLSEGDNSELPPDLKVGARVKIAPTNDRAIERVGTIRYYGSTEFALGTWVGIEYDEPVGKNDGTVAGKRYFQCRSNYGGFVKPERCQIGNWPTLEDELGLESE